MPALLEVAEEELAVGAEEDKKYMSVEMAAPCSDNEWERASKKKNSITLKCRVCGAYWKTRLEFFQKCVDFYAGNCLKGRDCEHPHIFSKACEKHHHDADAQKDAAVAAAAAEAVETAVSSVSSGSSPLAPPALPLSAAGVLLFDLSSAPPPNTRRLFERPGNSCSPPDSRGDSKVAPAIASSRTQ
ncbi:hypothetical protein DIPPA_01581 [Diplonema papillatum]|nr:hypothetical protein DIPPA_01581 [Diplonema papillatum]